jgi:hypothetical protein
MKLMLLEISTPDGRRLRQHHESIEAAKAKLTAGYAVTGTVSLADSDGNGGFVAPLAGPTFLTKLLEAHGDELLTWLESKGFKVKQ